VRKSEREGLALGFFIWISGLGGSCMHKHSRQKTDYMVAHVQIFFISESICLYAWMYAGVQRLGVGSRSVVFWGFERTGKVVVHRSGYLDESYHIYLEI